MQIGFPAPSPEWALFLDFDGTLVEIAPRPQDVRVSQALQTTLTALHIYFDGALALISGRPIAELDKFLSPLRLAAAGLHGVEWRLSADGPIECDPGSPETLDRLRKQFANYRDKHSGILIEDKKSALAIHYREVPHLESEILSLARRWLPKDRSASIMRGKMVVEIRTAGADKGKVLERFLDMPPFAGRIPVFIGDDRTDEDGFAIANLLGGESIRVGPPPAHVEQSCAKWQCENVGSLLAWLANLRG